MWRGRRYNRTWNRSRKRFRRTYPTRRIRRFRYNRTGGFISKVRKAAAMADKEMKFYDTNVGTTSIPTYEGGGALVTPTIVNMAQGSGASQRIGRKIQLKKIQCKFEVKPYTSAVDPQPCTVRIMLIMDRQSNGSTPVVGDVLQNIAGFPPTVHFNRLDNCYRFRILASKSFSTNMVQSDIFNERHVELSHTFAQPVSVEYGSNDGGADTVFTNNIFVLMLAGCPGKVEIIQSYRVRYYG